MFFFSRRVPVYKSGRLIHPIPCPPERGPALEGDGSGLPARSPDARSPLAGDGSAVAGSPPAVVRAITAARGPASHPGMVGHLRRGCAGPAVAGLARPFRATWTASPVESLGTDTGGGSVFD